MGYCAQRKTLAPAEGKLMFRTVSEPSPGGRYTDPRVCSHCRGKSYIDATSGNAWQCCHCGYDLESTNVHLTARDPGHCRAGVKGHRAFVEGLRIMTSEEAKDSD